MPKNETPQALSGERNEERVSPPSPLGGLEERCELPQRGSLVGGAKLMEHILALKTLSGLTGKTSVTGSNF